MVNSVYVVYCNDNKEDQEYVKNFKNVLERENIMLDFSFGDTDNIEAVEKKIEDCTAVLLLTSDAFRKNELVNQTVKIAHDLNKKFLTMGYHSGGLFNKQSWLKKDMDVNTVVYGFKNDEQLGEVLAQLRSVLGLAVAMGDRVGGLMVFNLDSPCCLYANEKLMFTAENPGTYKYRLKAGNYNLVVKSIKIKGVDVLSGHIDVKTNEVYRYEKSVTEAEIDYLSRMKKTTENCIFNYNNNIKQINDEIKNCEYQIDSLTQRLKEKTPYLPPAEASTGTQVLYALIFGGIGLMIAGFGAIVGLFLGPYMAQRRAEKKREKRLEKLVVDYNRRMALYRNQKNNYTSKRRELTEGLANVNKNLYSMEQQLNNINHLLDTY